jgi:NAD(P)-dependent dehydrogenase (short-subunit alcohol dehydrogenase family)
MTVLHETVDVTRTPDEAFAYISDFTTTVEWDSTAIAARKLTPGAIAVGTEFEVECALPVGSITVLYTVRELQANTRIVLRGSCRFFDIEDTISCAALATGTRIDYRAEFFFKPLIAPIAGFSQKGLEAMGRESVAGLGLALNDKFSVEQPPEAGRLSDRLVLPGLSLFSKLGYKLARKRFHPMSASVKNKHMVITGASSGLGYATALDLARRGARLTLVARDQAKAEKTAAELKTETGNSAIRVELADLSLVTDVDALIARLNKRGEPIDVLINNAGALFNPRRETGEGLEQSFALLLLSPYRLTEGLKPLLCMATSPRVINVVSGGMYSEKLNVDELILPDTSDYSGSVAYARQKRALMVLTQEWAASWAKDGIVVNAMHPGWADTPGVRSALPEFSKLTSRVLRSPEEGADTIVWLAVATEADTVSGKLFLDRDIRSAHLLGKTVESSAERKKLLRFLKTHQTS